MIWRSIIDVVESPCFWFQGMKEQYMDIPVNIRQRLDDVNGDEYCGFYVTEVTFKCDVTLETKLRDLARNIQSQLKTIIGQDQHLLFAKVKFRFSKKATKEYLPNLLVNTFWGQIFVFQVRDHKFWLLAYFFILLSCTKFQQDWTTLILDIL